MKSSLYTILFLFLALSMQGQSLLEETIFKAKDEFEAGRLDAVVELLSPYAFAYNQDKQQRKIALRILVESYLFLDEEEKARQIYLELLRTDPFYKIETDVPELKYLRDRIETYPTSTYRLNSGAFIFSEPVLKTQFSPPDVDIRAYNYNLDSIASPIGSFVTLSAAYKLFDSNWDLSIGYTNSTQYYYYNASLFDNAHSVNANLHFFEKQRWSHLSIGLHHLFLKRGRVIYRSFAPFISGYASYGILHRGQNFINDLKIEFEDGTNISKAPFLVDDLRNRTNFMLELELGGRIQAKRYFVEFGVRYNRFLKIIPNAQGRNENSELVNTFLYVDDDFTYHNFGLFIGTGVYFFKSRTKK